MVVSIEPHQLLKAGAYLPATTSLPNDAVVDQIDARFYVHPALGDRPVVRLTSTSLAPGEDSSMEYFGFTAGRVVEQVARRQRQLLGFPQWVLVHDPANGVRALEVSKALNRQARAAKSKPGHAKEAFDVIAEDLARTLPHFLPSYYEQVGRAFLEAGNTAYAASAFGKARDAEQIYALEVDENQRREAFIEFALAGALTNKAMTDYATDLIKRYGDGQAYEIFFDLCVRRTLGGTPPHAALVDQLRKLVRIAGLKQADEDARFIREVWQAPSLSRAAVKFWKTYRKPFAKLAVKDAAMRGRLLNLFPTPQGAEAAYKIEWLEFLEECGALDALYEPAGQMAVAAAPEDSAAAWLSRTLSHSMERYSWRSSSNQPDVVFGIMRRMAARLKNDGVELSFGDGGYYSKADIDLVDLAIELEIPVVSQANFDLAGWAGADAESSEHLRDLVFVGNDARFALSLDSAVGEAFGNAEFQRVAKGRSGLERARRAWLTERISELSRGALPAFVATESTLSANVSAATFAEFPDAYELGCQVDLVSPLWRTLQTGLLDEFCWPAYEEAFEELSTKGKNASSPTLVAIFPFAMLYNALRAIVVGPKGRVLEHDLQLPAGSRLNWVRYAGGQLLVGFYDSHWRGSAYWSGNPSEIFDFTSHLGQPGVAIELADGGISYGGRALYPGDKDGLASGLVLSDKENYWTLRGDWNDQSLAEFDPRTGTVGRRSMPRFFEDFVAEGKQLNISRFELYPLSEEMQDSPLGGKDGLYGWRVRTPLLAPYLTEWESIDGRRFALSTPGFSGPVALAKFPGDELLRPITADLSICAHDGGYVASTASHTASALGYLNFRFMHLCTARDGDGSTSLRNLSADAVATLVLAAVLGDLAASTTTVAKSERLAAWIDELCVRIVSSGLALKSEATLYACGEHWAGVLRGEREAGKAPKAVELEALVASIVANASDKGFIEAVASVVQEAAQAAQSYIKLFESASPQNLVNNPIGDAIEDGDISQALNSVGLHQFGYWWNNGAVSLIDALRSERRFLFEGDDGAAHVFLKTPWQQLFGREGALAFIASRHGRDPNSSRRITALLTTWAELGFLEYEGQLRLVNYSILDTNAASYLPKNQESGVWATVYEGNRYTGVLQSSYATNQSNVLEYAPDGKFKVLAGANMTSERVLSRSSFTSANIARFVLAMSEKGQVPWSAEAATKLAELTGLSFAEAALIWVGMPNISSWEKNFLSKELRTEMGLKVTEADAARSTLRGLNVEKLFEFYERSFPANPEELWSIGANGEDSFGVVATMAKAWNEVFGKKTALPDALIIEVDKNLRLTLNSRALLTALVDPSSSQTYSRAVQSRFNIENRNYPSVYTVAVEDDPAVTEPLFGDGPFADAMSLIAYMYLMYPVGDALRANAQALYKAVYDQLASPKLLAFLHTEYFYGEDAAKNALRKNQWLDSLGGARREGLGIDLVETESMVALGGMYSCSQYYRTHFLLGGGALPVEQRALRASYPQIDAALTRIEILVSEGFRALCERACTSPVAEGEYEANALHSVPELVAQVRERFGVSEDAAVLFLQTLTLYNPTTANVRIWNGWTAARYTKAGKELVVKKILVEAKRARAGRSYFIDGGWEAFKTPHLPIETWKLQIYRTTADAHSPLGNIVVLEPVHTLFERAWKRFEDGDVPSF